MRSRRTIALMSLILTTPLLVVAANNSSERVAAFGALPDWRGIWKVEGSTATFDGKSGSKALTGAPYNSDWQKKYAADRRNAAKLRDSYERFCYAGVPRMMASPQYLMFVIAPEETVVLGSRHDIRHLWTDGRQHTPADEMWPMFWGDSVARWEGQTLLVDTISLKGDLWLDPTGATLSEAFSVSERIALTATGKLVDEITIRDSGALSRAWSVVRTYNRTALTDLPEENCQWTAGSAGRKTR
jgi:hypothetical protein